jgi:membrane protein implicated in regulation of membrane protease activity
MAGTADWSIAVGILVFIIAIIFAAYYFLKYRRIFTVVFIASIATYVFAVFYTWDVFELNKNMILAILAISAVVMIFLGKYFSKYELKPAKMHTSLKEKKQ